MNRSLQVDKQFLKNIRDNIPEPVKYLIAPIFRNKLLRNKDFKHYYNLLTERERLSKEEILEYQFRRLKEILIHAQKNVPYYSELFKKAGFNADKFTDFEQIKVVPFLSREIINKNFNKLISVKRVNNGFYQGSTGGSSGVPLSFLLDYDSIFKENAFIYYYRKKLGYTFKDKCATFRVPDYSNPVWELNPMHNELVLSPFMLSNAVINKYAGRIESYDPQYFNGYLSAIWFFTRLLHENKIKLKLNLKGIFLISENMDREQRAFVEDFYNVKSMSFYGHSERCVIAEELSNDKYVFDPYYGYTEKLLVEGDKKLIVGTGFLNYTMPFIRYKTDDICIKENDHYKIEGKRTSAIGLIGINNEFLSSTIFDLENPVFKNVLNYQFIQHHKGKADLNIIVNSNFKSSDLELCKKEIDNYTRGIIKIEIKVVEKLILSPRGKYQMYISSLSGDSD